MDAMNVVIIPMEIKSAQNASDNSCFVRSRIYRLKFMSFS